jgi:hypothetical protein
MQNAITRKKRKKMKLFTARVYDLRVVHNSIIYRLTDKQIYHILRFRIGLEYDDTFLVHANSRYPFFFQNFKVFDLYEMRTVDAINGDSSVRDKLKI